MLKFLGQLVSQTKVKKNNTANVSFKTKTKTNLAAVAQQEGFFCTFSYIIVPRRTSTFNVYTL